MTDQTSASPDFALDDLALRRFYNRAAAHYREHAWFAREVSQRMQEKLDFVHFTPQRILDIGCGTGDDLAALQQRYPQADLLACDSSVAMVQHGRGERGFGDKMKRLFSAFQSGPQTHWLSADARQLPLPSRHCSMVWSNQMLHCLADPTSALKEMHRVLEVGGLLMFSTLGPDSLKELRRVLPAHRVQPFIDMHDLGDALVNAGFSDPVMDMEMLTVTYSHPDSLLRDLRQIGAQNTTQQRPKGLGGKAVWQHARAGLDTLRQSRSDQHIPLTLEIVYGHAWKPEPKTLEDGRAVMQFHKQRPQ